jgi:hypothetical protein
MPKPILVVNYHIGNLPTQAVIQNIKQLRKVLEDQGANEEYYTFVLPVQGDSFIQVFYEKDLNETSYLELKQMIQDKLDKL